MIGVVFFFVFFCISINHKKIPILIQILSFQKCVLDAVLYLIQYYVFDTVSGVDTNPWGQIIDRGDVVVVVNVHTAMHCTNNQRRAVVR